MMKIIKADSREFNNFFKALLNRHGKESPEVEKRVSRIIERVKKYGDRALIELTKKFDGVNIKPDTLKVSEKEFIAAENMVPGDVKKAMRTAMTRIKKYHLKYLKGSRVYSEKKGIFLGQGMRAIETVGIYVPGGKASYPSSVFMNAIPARIAGVKKIIMCFPAPKGDLNPYPLVAARWSGVDEVYRIGGAQAIAAMAFGTETVPRVDKIVGPGNIYVATAKRMVFGKVGIDMVAGPTEIVVVADAGANPKYIAADLLSQAEHDETASAILITNSEKIASQVKKEISAQIKKLNRSEIAIRALEKFGAIIITETISDGIGIANRIAPEHLEIMVKNPMRLVSKVENAGAVFLGSYTPEVLGDYAAGPSHVLPTGGTARFSSVLSVDDFVKRISIVSFNRKEFLKLKRLLITFASIEGLDAHARSAMVRK
ncbi:MAG: histidinol dehydrogenase [Candidatus Schekmanbacteria bacterium RIFCSPHIGHO2_02_FULL_38_11]|uniref:Histidinol dehydrogenase n=1 Tax=Candidatus Schekmanbacteria bacterium RIFCSPLOWO2_12_FULL_38_15 TaxID=1817883 RepID=A0A1F7SMN5_9BACT|nr:MAG: histidinol dehydrogenase [Candidatus Schekmanbacteria bacterium GWA2_38_9]OGL48017.1 MAG: histidinol dehydrogenase [Candidatus Schekmanbacteria bacterium RIFCSPLOWO2_02_FULL_38_14]OGL48332.1 MAG: histidinol dehydrogenase [Candidatus Schekmanbacteria bacterium RIFCSPHIGHO2_02_FULL_38_11]OGL54498.1 MAG: histidinol dehydrogenase [Candidatus Schekmanbacteria bacterium RIFCSPLOWO2_12_FULL_38_15]